MDLHNTCTKEVNAEIETEQKEKMELENKKRGKRGEKTKSS